MSELQMELAPPLKMQQKLSVPVTFGERKQNVEISTAFACRTTGPVFV